MARPPQASVIGKSARVLYLLVNFVVWIFGLILIAVGGFILQYRDVYAFVYVTSASDLTIGCWILIGLGCLVFLVGFNGVWACVRESVLWMKVYFVFMLLIIIGGFATGILTLTRREEARNTVKRNMMEIIKNEYGKGGIVDTGYDNIHQSEQCCGVSGPGDWNSSYFLTLTGNEDLAVPLSCCKPDMPTDCNYGKPGQPAKPEDVFDSGCGETLANFQSDNMTLMGMISFIMVGLETISLLLVCCVIGTRPVPQPVPDDEKEESVRVQEEEEEEEDDKL
ncbi:tetraspanin-11-like [Patiria miniata]|uniref:Tetraspanin n=1 Tax=Patiria miniata TaxID=46514 RepID=A0A913ZMX7_PATMI|nr:tetraspanin-11-like [Patiria miniata]